MDEKNERMKGFFTKKMTFAIGGVHPSAYKLAAQYATEEMAPGGIVSLFLSQHIGAPAMAVVNKGDRVKTGQLVAKANGFVSANIHSSVSGVVLAVEPVADITGHCRPAVVIQVEGDEWEEGIDRTPDIVRDIPAAAAIIRKVADAGIVGLGGAAFPTHVKLSLPPGKQARTLIINAAECEPYLTSDHRVMLEAGEQAIIGALLLARALNAPEACIGVEVNKPDAIAHLRQIIRRNNYAIRLVPLKQRYPQGSEKQLVEAITGRRVPSMKLPVDAGAVVQNIGTALAVYEAVQKNKPLIDNCLTITGLSAARQVNARVRTGTPLSKVAAWAGGIPEDTGKIVCGGPMMGKAVANINAPTVKTTAAILYIPERKALRKKSSNCIRCAKCVQACPMGLEPYLLIRLTQRGLYDDLQTNRTYDCIECGCCLYSCPAQIPLLDYIRMGKAQVLQRMKG